MGSPLEIAIANRQTTYAIDHQRIETIARHALISNGVSRGEVSIAIVDNAEMHRLNVTHLQHDYPTDVLSFVFSHDEGYLEGEIVVSADYAVNEALLHGWAWENELLLYVVHGTLHLAGFDDTSPHLAQTMQAMERKVLAAFQLLPPGRGE